MKFTTLLLAASLASVNGQSFKISDSTLVSSTCPMYSAISSFAEPTGFFLTETGKSDVLGHGALDGTYSGLCLTSSSAVCSCTSVYDAPRSTLTCKVNGQTCKGVYDVIMTPHLHSPSSHEEEEEEQLVTADFLADGASSTCGGNCPGGCSSCPCGSTVSKQDAATWCAKYSGWKQSSCVCIASHESGANAYAANENVDGSFDVGFWQINDFNWDSCSGGKAPCDMSTNLECAKKVFAWGGNTWKNWSTCGACGVCNSN